MEFLRRFVSQSLSEETDFNLIFIIYLYNSIDTDLPIVDVEDLRFAITLDPYRKITEQSFFLANLWYLRFWLLKNLSFSREVKGSSHMFSNIFLYH